MVGRSATPRRCLPSRAGPLTESQLADIRRAVDCVRGSGARSVKVHGVIVYLDNQHRGPGQLPNPRSMTPAVGAEGAATTRRPDAELNSKQRRSRRRLDERIAANAAAIPRPNRKLCGMML